MSACNIYTLMKVNHEVNMHVIKQNIMYLTWCNVECHVTISVFIRQACGPAWCNSSHYTSHVITSQTISAVHTVQIRTCWKKTCFTKTTFIVCIYIVNINLLISSSYTIGISNKSNYEHAKHKTYIQILQNQNYKKEEEEEGGGGGGGKKTRCWHQVVCACI